MEKQDSSKDLEGLLVVTIEQAVAAPYTSCRLADAGARVIKVERPEGCLLYTSPSPRDATLSRMPSSA